MFDLKELISKYNMIISGALHIGAHHATECGDYYKNGINKSIWIEANPKFSDIIKSNISKFENTKYFNYLISDLDGQKLIFNISNNDGQSSSIFELDYHKIAHPEVHYIDKIELETKRIDTIFKENKLEMKDYNYVNMDIQGAEYLALVGFGSLLNEVDYISLEINEKELYKGCALFPQITEYLESYGFQFKEKVMWSNCGWGDAFFIKNK